jgi:hypothetical protein
MMNDECSDCKVFSRAESTLSNNKPRGFHPRGPAEFRAYGQYESYNTDILKNAFLQSMYDQNQARHCRSILTSGSFLQTIA